jgi:hypothetical protein
MVLALRDELLCVVTSSAEKEAALADEVDALKQKLAAAGVCLRPKPTNPSAFCAIRIRSCMFLSRVSIPTQRYYPFEQRCVRLCRRQIRQSWQLSETVVYGVQPR